MDLNPVEPHSFIEVTRRWPDLPSAGRALMFDSLSASAQAACWSELKHHAALSLDGELLYEERLEEEWPPPKRQSASQATPHSTSTGTDLVDADHKDPLKRVPAKEYVTAFTAIPVPASAKIRCPLHDERTPSFKIYDSRFHCFGCGADGDIYDLASALSGIEARGAGFIALREWIAKALIAEGVHV